MENNVSLPWGMECGLFDSATYDLAGFRVRAKFEMPFREWHVAGRV